MKKVVKVSYLIILTIFFCFNISPVSAETCTSDDDCSSLMLGEEKFFCEEGNCILPKNNGEPCYFDEHCHSKRCSNNFCVVPVGEDCPTPESDCISKVCKSALLKKICACKAQEHCPSGQFCTTFGLCLAKYKAGQSCTTETEVTCESGKCEINFGETTGKCSDASLLKAEDPNSGELPELKLDMATPDLKVQIPNFLGFTKETLKPGQLMGFSWIAQYISAVFKYAIALGSVIAVIQFMIGGINYLLAAGNFAQQNKAKQTILGSLVGLTVFLSSYLLLNLVNPALITMESLSIDILEEEIDPSNLETRSFNPPGKSENTTFVCNADGKAIHRKSGKLLDISKIRGNGYNFSPHPGQKGIPFYETDHGMFQRKIPPDIIIIHATAGNRFLDASSFYGGPAVHYLVDRNGDVSQSIYEEQYTYSVKNLDAGRRAISYELVNLYSVCGANKFQKNKLRRSGVDPKRISKKHPLCLEVKTITPTQVHDFCPCAKLNIPRLKDECYEEFSDAQFRSVAKLTAWVAKRYNIPIVHPVERNPKQGKNCPSMHQAGYCWNYGAGIVGHNDLQGDTHGDPGPAWDWDKFLALVKSYMGSVPNVTFGAKEYNDNLFK
ncbi:MAG: N-acetylmuramoyl-L-alanine amidase [Patescibacteria group bacterium]